jgi:hypothetical protein
MGTGFIKPTHFGAIWRLIRLHFHFGGIMIFQSVSSGDRFSFLYELPDLFGIKKIGEYGESMVIIMIDLLSVEHVSFWL